MTHPAFKAPFLQLVLLVASGSSQATDGPGLRRLHRIRDDELSPVSKSSQTRKLQRLHPSKLQICLLLRENFIQNSFGDSSGAHRKLRDFSQWVRRTAKKHVTDGLCLLILLVCKLTLDGRLRLEYFHQKNRKKSPSYEFFT